MEDVHTTNSNYQDQALRLMHELDNTASPDLYDQQLAHLRKLDQVPIVNGLCKLLTHPDAAIRCRAGEVLLVLDADRNLDQVLPLLKDSDENVRFVITRWLCTYGDYRAVEALMDVLAHDTDSTARFYAALALGNIGDARALSVLRHVACHDDGVNYEGELVRSSVKQAIEHILKHETPSDSDCA